MSSASTHSLSIGLVHLVTGRLVNCNKLAEMSSSNPILRWEKVGKAFYRNHEGYLLQWDIDDLANYTLASAPYGGAIAVYRTPRRVLESTILSSHQAIFIYSGSGQFIHSMPWERNGPEIVGIGWNQREQLLVVTAKGLARCYYDFDGNFWEFSIGQVAETHGVREVKFFANVFIVRLINNQFIVVHGPNYRQTRSIQGPELDGSSVYGGWSAVVDESSLDHGIEIIASINNQVFSLSHKAPQSRGVTSGPFEFVSISPDSSNVALLNEKFILCIYTLDLQSKLGEFKLGQQSTPSQLVWCGTNAVAAVFDDEIELFEINSTQTTSGATLWFDSTVVAVQEMDGMRTITNQKHDFFTKVPDVSVGIFQLGSTSPGAILRDCVGHIERKSPKADENLMIIGDRLKEAVDSCIEAAGYEYEVSWQKKLLRAASFGKSALPYYNSDKYVRISEYLRALNSIREFKIGMLTSYNQLIRLGPLQLINRLLLRNAHLLAFKVAELLRLPKENIYVHWACAKIRRSQTDDDSTYAVVVQKVAEVSGINYEEIAQVAYEEGRSKLAILLLERETRPEKQIPLLLSMGEDQLALQEADKSADVYIIFYVLVCLKEKLSIAAFFKLLNDTTSGPKCFELLCKADGNIESIELLKKFYYQDDRRLDTAQLDYQIALLQQKNTLDEAITQLAEVKRAYQSISGKNFASKAVGEQERLLKLQKQLEVDFDQPFVGLSVSQTISNLLTEGQTSRAAKVKDDFKVTESRYWWIMLQALVARKDWDHLERFAKSKKSPIGYYPFYNECIKAGNQKAAAKYVSSCTNFDYKKRIDMFVECNDIRGAVGEASKAKDAECLEELKALSTPGLQREIDAELDRILKR